MQSRFACTGSRRGGGSHQGCLFPLFALLFVLLACCLLIGFSFEQSWLTSCFGSPVPRWLGLISFSIYLLHLPLLPLKGVLIQAFTGTRPVNAYEVASISEGLICMVVVLGLSTLSYLYVEKPMQRRLRSAFSIYNDRKKAPTH